MNAGYLFAGAGPLYLIAVAWPLTKIDLRERRLPNKLVLPAFPIAILGHFVASALLDQWLSLWLAMGFAALAFGVGLLLNHFAGLGMGDVKLIAAMTLSLGWFGGVLPVLALFLAFVIAGALVLCQLALGRTSIGVSVALGPYLLSGFALSTGFLVVTRGFAAGLWFA
ncbi:MAG: hypothetical protein RLZZ229_501 [Actinomycetota bacterium]|jgi:leader peptidase (prepilin peptidase) / N-methyltransferase